MCTKCQHGHIYYNYIILYDNNICIYILYVSVYLYSEDIIIINDVAITRKLLFLVIAYIIWSYSKVINDRIDF